MYAYYSIRSSCIHTPLLCPANKPRSTYRLSHINHLTYQCLYNKLTLLKQVTVIFQSLSIRPGIRLIPLLLVCTHWHPLAIPNHHHISIRHVYVISVCYPSYISSTKSALKYIHQTRHPLASSPTRKQHTGKLSSCTNA